MCEAKLPDVYVLIESSSRVIPAKFALFSLSSATVSCLISVAISIDFVLLYPSVVILYLMAIIFLISSMFSFYILYFSLYL